MVLDQGRCEAEVALTDQEDSFVRFEGDGRLVVLLLLMLLLLLVLILVLRFLGCRGRGRGLIGTWSVGVPAVGYVVGELPFFRHGRDGWCVEALRSGIYVCRT